jgi:hypothetical protein
MSENSYNHMAIRNPILLEPLRIIFLHLQVNSIDIVVYLFYQAL